MPCSHCFPAGDKNDDNELPELHPGGFRLKQVYGVFLPEFMKTQPRLSILPACISFAQKANGLELYNMDTGFIAARHDAYSYPDNDTYDSTVLWWDDQKYPELKMMYSGRYKCRTDAGSSTATYNLHVTGKKTIMM